tara:strand:- start:206 stop:520 length:315 start_codon:yes stop_codon:yes gene_type:complete
MIKKINYILVIFLTSLFLNSCEGFKLKKKSSSGEEFLINKKDPLILPPDFSELPKPNEKITENDDNEDDIDFEKVFNGDGNKKSKSEEVTSESGIKKSILEKIQ